MVRYQLERKAICHFYQLPIPKAAYVELSLFCHIFQLDLCRARRGGAEVAGWTLDRKIRV